MEPIKESLSFDDVLIMPMYSSILPAQVDVKSYLTKNILINIPIVSAAMDTVTESALAISMARAGGIGFIHRNMSIENQAKEVDKVKKSEAGMITDPITISPNEPISNALSIMASYKISGVPVVGANKKLVGIVTNRDLRFETNFDKKIQDVMTSEDLVTIMEGTSLEESKELLHKHKIEKLLVVDKKGKLKGLITIKDLSNIKKYPVSCKDDMGRLRVGAAVGVGDDMLIRVKALIEAKADIILLDAAHGNSKNVIKAVEQLKKKFKQIEIIAGNVIDEDGVKNLIDAGADAVKVGVGPGSICTTRIVSGVGFPQLSAVMSCYSMAKKYKVPLIADGGIKFSGDITKAIGAGANSVMLGNLLAGTEESPGETIFYHGRNYKAYRGMGSLEAMQQGSGDRYHQENIEAKKLVPEGIVGRVAYKGSVADNLHQLIGGLKSGMGYVGAENIKVLQEKAKFVKISFAGVKESHAHNVIITKGAPNYKMDDSF